MKIDITIVADQEAFLVDAPTPQASPRRWIQAKGGFNAGSLVSRRGAACTNTPLTKGQTLLVGTNSGK